MALPLIAAQPGIWLADKLSSFDNAYTVVHYLELFGEVRLNILCDAIMQAMHETDTLKFSFVEVDGEVLQVPDGALPLPAPEIWDLRKDVDPIRSSKELMKQDMKANVRIDSGNALIRHVIMQVEDRKWFWYQRFHHIQLDAFSFTALTRRTVDLYSSKIRNTVPVITQAFQPIQSAVKEYLEYQESPKYSKDSDFWKKFCGALPESSTLSTSPLNDVEPSKNIIRNKMTMSQTIFRKLCDSVTIHNDLQDADVALALLAIWILRLSNRSSMSAGFIFMRRLGSAAINTAGPFINVLPIPLSLENTEDASPLNLVSVALNLRKTLKLVRRHQKYDSEKIVRDSGRGWDVDPLFGPVINFKAFDYRLDFEGVEYKTHHIASGPIRDIELVLYITETGDLEVEYLANGDRYESQVLDAHLARFPLLLDQFAQDPLNLTCEDVSILLPDELAMIQKANSTTQPLDPNDTLVSLVQKQVEANSIAVALEDEAHSLTYGEMQRQVHALSSALLDAGVRRGDIVAVALPRSVFLSLALQAVINAGASWLPLDANYPKERLRMMIEDSHPKLIITGPIWELETSFKTFKFDSLFNDEARINSHPKVEVASSDVAYIIYTSGSTGKPKGVSVSHRAIVNRLLWMQAEYGLDQSDAVLQKTPSSFDVSVWEFFWPLISGARLFMAPPEAHRDPEILLNLILERSITTIHFVPSMLSTFLTGATACKVSSILRRTFCSGEALSTSLSRKWEKTTHVPLFNLYGPTEAAIDVTAYPAFGENLTSHKTVPIGFPVWNTQIHVLDRQMHALPPSMAGDLYISGAQLAEGYLNRPELTAERFIEIQGKKMYRTGDVAQWLPEVGAVEFLGRSDDQVKLRGQRIELGEIDAVLESLPGVAQATTQPQNLLGTGDDVEEQDSRQLVGYLVATSPDSLDLEELHQRLRCMLPGYMVPAKLIALDSLPLSASGKLDRRALPLPKVDSRDATLHRRPPAEGLERVVANAFQELLHVDHEISAEDDFFTLGGHSLLAVRLASILRRDTGLPVTIGQIMLSPKVSSLAAKLEDSSTKESWSSAGFESSLPLRVNRQGKTLFCFHPASGFAWQFSVLQRYLNPYWSLVGIQSATPDGVLAQSERLEDVVESHFQTVLRECPSGPYFLLGYSLGGTLAHSLAAKLTASGKEVAFLGLLDTWPPETQNWDEKRGRVVVDEAVIEEMYRERQQFVDAQQGAFNEDGENSKLFDTIESNYISAVRLLATAKSSRFEGLVTLFVAEKTFPEGTDLQEVWRRWAQRLETIPMDCSHLDIISPKTFERLGPKLDALLSKFIN